MTEEIHEEYQVCYKHKDRKTLLRCNKCNRPICLECAVQTPTGYRCKDCIKTQQQVFDTAQTKDYIIGGMIAFVLAFAGSYVEQMIPFLSFLSAVIVGGAVGKLICTAVRSAVSKRRSRTLNVVVLAAAGIGSLLPRLTGIRIIIEYYIEMGMVLSGLTQILMSLLYVIVLCLTIRFDLEGMIFRR